jgi:hypothetical protein
MLLKIPCSGFGLKLSNPKPGCRKAAFHLFMKLMPPIDSDKCNIHPPVPALIHVSLLEI